MSNEGEGRDEATWNLQGASLTLFWRYTLMCRYYEIFIQQTDLAIKDSWYNTYF